MPPSPQEDCHTSDRDTEGPEDPEFAGHAPLLRLDAIWGVEVEEAHAEDGADEGSRQEDEAEEAYCAHGGAVF